MSSENFGDKISFVPKLSDFCVCMCVHVPACMLHVFWKHQKAPPAAFKTRQICLRPVGNLK